MVDFIQFKPFIYSQEKPSPRRLYDFLPEACGELITKAVLESKCFLIPCHATCQQNMLPFRISISRAASPLLPKNQKKCFLKVVENTRHKIHHFNNYKVYNSVTSATFTALCHRHNYLSSRTLPPHKKEAPHPLNSHSAFSPPFPLHQQLICFLTLWRPVPVLYIPCKQNHTVHGLWSLASFIQLNVFKVHPCCNVYQRFILSRAEKPYPTLVIP